MLPWVPNPDGLLLPWVPNPDGLIPSWAPNPGGLLLSLEPNPDGALPPDGLEVPKVIEAPVPEGGALLAGLLLPIP